MMMNLPTLCLLQIVFLLIPVEIALLIISTERKEERALHFRWDSYTRAA